MTYKYATHMDGARAVGKDLPISTKHSVEVCRYIRDKPVKQAKKLLQEVITLKRPVPYKRYNRDVGHKAGMASGRFPKKTSQEILKIVESAEVNAQFKGMNTAHLVIAHSVAHKASRPFHAGRQRGRYMKRTHVEIVVCESTPRVKELKKAMEQKKTEMKSQRLEVLDESKTSSSEEKMQTKELTTGKKENKGDLK